MKSLLAVASLLVVALVLASPAALGAEPNKTMVATPPAMAKGDSAQALVRITFDPKQCLLNEAVFQQYLQSPAVRGEAIAKMRDKVKLVAGASSFGIEATLAGASENQLLVKLDVWTPKNDPPVAKEFLKLVLWNLNALLEKAGTLDENRMAMMDHDLDATTKKVTVERENLSRFIQENGSQDLSRTAAFARSSAIQAEMEKVYMDLAGKQARQHALEEQSKRLAEKIAVSSKDDPMLAELEKVVKLREDELAATKGLAKAAVVSTAEVAACEVKVADARVELLKRKEAASATGRELLAKLRDEEVSLAMDIWELEARHNLLNEARSRAADFMKASAEYEQLVQAKEMAERDLEKSTQQNQDARKQRGNVPAVTVIVEY
jgi:hypothetical protein